LLIKELLATRVILLRAAHGVCDKLDSGLYGKVWMGRLSSEEAVMGQLQLNYPQAESFLFAAATAYCPQHAWF
jgi:hypothetical protein